MMKTCRQPLFLDPFHHGSTSAWTWPSVTLQGRSLHGQNDLADGANTPAGHRSLLTIHLRVASRRKPVEPPMSSARAPAATNTRWSPRSWQAERTSPSACTRRPGDARLRPRIAGPPGQDRRTRCRQKLSAFMGRPCSPPSDTPPTEGEAALEALVVRRRPTQGARRPGSGSLDEHHHHPGVKKDGGSCCKSNSDCPPGEDRGAGRRAARGRRRGQVHELNA